MKLASTSQGAEIEAALASAMASDTAQAESLAHDLGKRFPLDTQMQFAPAIRAHAHGGDRAEPLCYGEVACSLQLFDAQAVECSGYLCSANCIRGLSCAPTVRLRGVAWLGDLISARWTWAWLSCGSDSDRG